jgi:hypothetical protein
MSEMWEQEGFSCAGSDLRGDLKKELKARHINRACLVGSSLSLADTRAWLLPSIVL